MFNNVVNRKVKRKFNPYKLDMSFEVLQVYNFVHLCRLPIRNCTVVCHVTKPNAIICAFSYSTVVITC